MRVLLDALEDEYPAVRWFAWRALKKLGADQPSLRALVERFEVQGDPAARIELVDALRRHLGPSSLHEHEERRTALQAQRDDQLIEIGE